MKQLGKISVYAGLIFWTLLVIAPYVMILLLSLRDNLDIFRDGLGLTGDFQPKNYVDAWSGGSGATGMSTYFINSIITALTAMTVSLGVGTVGAYFSIHFNNKWKERFLQAFVLMSVVPLVLLVVPYYQAYNTLGILNMPVMVGIAYGALTLPTTVLIMQSFYADFPKELIEAAAMDGAGPWRTFGKFVLPLSKGAITAVGMLVLVFVWGETQIGVILLQSPDSQTVPVGLLSFQGQWSANLGAIFAGLAIASFPVIALYLALNKNLSRGIAMGGFGGK